MFPSLVGLGIFQRKKAGKAFVLNKMGCFCIDTMAFCLVVFLDVGKRLETIQMLTCVVWCVSICITWKCTWLHMKVSREACCLLSSFVFSPSSSRKLSEFI